MKIYLWNQWCWFCWGLVLYSNGIWGQQFDLRQWACSDGVSRPYVVYTPAGTSKTARPLVVFLHGGIGASGVKKDPVEYARKSPWVALADEGNFCLLFPFGEQKASWFDPVGTQMLLGEIEQLKWNRVADPERVFLTGFSDGGSGVFYLAMTTPDPFAGFIPMNGSIKVASMLGKEGIYPENMNGKPMYVINTQEDILYPLEQMEAAANYLKAYNPHVTFRPLAGGHDMSYFATEKPALLSFINTHQRTFLTEISLESSSQGKTSIGWLTLKKIDTSATKAQWHTSYKYKIQNNKADFGLKYDYSYRGVGVRVSGFKSDTATAKRMGVQVGDVLIQMEQDSISSPYSPLYYTARKRAGDSTSLTLMREEHPLILYGKFNAGYPYYLLNNKKPSGKIQGRIEGKYLYLKASCVADYQIDKRKLPCKIKKIILEK